MELTKICIKCGEEKPITEFTKVNNWCKTCKAEYDKEYYLKNKRRISERYKIYYKNHSDELKEYQKLYYIFNPGSIKKRSKEWAQNNKEKIRKFNKKWRENNSEKVKITAKKYRENNKEKIEEQNKIYRENHKEEIKIRNKKYNEENSEKIKERQRKYLLNNPEKRKETIKRYCEKNRTKININARKEYAENPKRRKKHAISVRKYYDKHKKEKIEYSKIYNKKRYQNDPIYRLNHNMSSAIAKSLKGNKNGYHWEDLINYTQDDLRQHLEGLFKNGMTWENYGRNGWHIDHIRPKSIFNIKGIQSKGFKECWKLENLRPMFEFENLSKKDKLFY